MGFVGAHCVRPYNVNRKAVKPILNLIEVSIYESQFISSERLFIR